MSSEPRDSSALSAKHERGSSSLSGTYTDPP